MIRLAKIKRENNIISAVITTVETKPKTFKLALDLETDKLVENTYGRMCMDVGMAKHKLRTLAEENGYNLPETDISSWY